MLNPFILNKLNVHQKVMLLVVMESNGSSPGRRGFKMAVATDGTMEGSIGGGKMEIELVEKAKELLKNEIQKTIIVPKIHRKNVSNSSGMICSGEQKILLFLLNKTHIPVFQATSGTLCISEQEIWIAESPLPPLSRGGIEGKPSSGSPLSGSPLDKGDLGDSKILYQEDINQKASLYIIGGGHCALALSELARKLDFEVHLFDDRPQLNTIQKNNFAQVSIIEHYEKISAYIPIARNQFVVVMTVGFMSDEVVIRALFERTFAYFGVLGSKAKIATLWKKLRLAGFDESKLNQIKAPIGLPIGSQTPMEIAISILAQIVQVKNNVG